MPQKQFINSYVGKFGSLAEAAVIGVIGASDLPSTFGNRVRRKSSLALVGFRHALQRSENLFDASFNVLGFLSIGLRHTSQNPRKSRHTLTIFWWKISAPIKGLSLRREKNSH